MISEHQLSKWTLCEFQLWFANITTHKVLTPKALIVQCKTIKRLFDCISRHKWLPLPFQNLFSMKKLPPFSPLVESSLSDKLEHLTEKRLVTIPHDNCNDCQRRNRSKHPSGAYGSRTHTIGYVTRQDETRTVWREPSSIFLRPSTYFTDGMSFVFLYFACINMCFK